MVKQGPRWAKNIYIYVYSAELARLLWGNGAISINGMRRVPWFIWASPRSVRESFMLGFILTSGTSMELSERELAEDLVMLAAVSGVPVYYHVASDGTQRIQVVKEGRMFNTWRGSVVMVGVKSLEFVDYDGPVYDFELEEVNHFVHSGGVVTHNCCRLAIQRTELRFTMRGLRLSKTDLEALREERVKMMERQRVGGVWAIPDTTGSINVIDVNLPRLALEASREESRFWELYDQALQLVAGGLMWFRQRYMKLLRKYPSMYSMILRYLPAFPATHFNTIGLIGLPEAVAILMQNPKLWFEESRREWAQATNLMKKLVEHARRYAREMMLKTGEPFNVEEVPGESAAAKLAAKDLRRFPELAEYLPDAEEPVYSTSIAPYYGAVDLGDRVWIESQVQKYFTGGVMMHIFLGEEPDPEALAKLTKKIMQTDVIYWSYTPAITFCPRCKTAFTGLYTACPKCGCGDVEVWSRIVGYYRPLQNWNPARRREFWHRRHYTF